LHAHMVTDARWNGKPALGIGMQVGCGLGGSFNSRQMQNCGSGGESEGMKGRKPRARSIPWSIID
jgi:hypothetical protein